MAKEMGTDVNDEQKLNQVRAACYPHLGYLTVRSIEYSVRAGPSGSPSVDGNDYEDGLICCHLTLATDRALVTADRGIRESLVTALNALRCVDFDPACRILSPEELQSEVLP